MTTENFGNSRQQKHTVQQLLGGHHPLHTCNRMRGKQANLVITFWRVSLPNVPQLILASWSSHPRIFLSRNGSEMTDVIH